MAVEQWKSKWMQIRELGEGSQGTTYEMVSLTDSGQRGVLKLLNDDSNQQARSRMAHEAINLEALAKQGVKVPRLLDHNTGAFGDPAVQVYLVMEFAPGETLDKVVKARGGRLSLEQSVAIARDLCATMAAMHKLGVLHRDLKPANLMVRDFDTADLVVLDLGLSFDRARKQESLTRTGETIKNELIALPEAITANGDRRDERSDITNIVALLFYCLTGHLAGHLRDQKDLAPHKRPGLTMQHVLSGDPRLQEVEFLFDSGYAVDIDNRFQTIKELEERLLLVLKPIDKSKKDPIKVAAELRTKFRRESRKMQLAEFRDSANGLWNLISRQLQLSSTQLDPFIVGFGGGSVDKPMPQGIELAMDVPPVLTVSVREHRNVRWLKFAFGAKGSRCALLALVVRHPRSNPSAVVGEWEQLIWYDPSQMPDTQEFVDRINAQLVVVMEDLAKEALGEVPS